MVLGLAQLGKESLRLVKEMHDLKRKTIMLPLMLAESWASTPSRMSALAH
jgi:hypothetical protein